MPGVYPKRDKPFWLYTPLISIIALFWWIIGVGLWIHFTNVAYNKSEDFIDILQVKINSGAAGQVNRIYTSMTATSIVFTIFAVCIHALGIWRGIIEQEQDINGEVDDLKGMYMSWLNVLVQIAWWVIVFWMIVMLSGFGAFAAFIYLLRTAINNILIYQSVYPPGPVIPNFCQTSCLSVLTTGLFLYSVDSTPDSEQFTLCICDTATLQAALKVANDAYNAVPGMITGLIFMIIYGIVLKAYMVSMLVRTGAEQGISDRLTDQGFATSIPLVPKNGRR